MYDYLAQNHFDIKDRHVYLNYNITYLNNMAIPISQLCHKKLWTNQTQMLHYSMWIITKICKVLDVDSKDDYFHINNKPGTSLVM